MKTIREIAEDIQKAKSVLNVTDDDNEEWLLMPQTKLFIINLVAEHSEALLSLAQMESGHGAERKRGEIQTLDRLINTLIEKEEKDD